MSDQGLKITGLHCGVAGNDDILKGIDLTVEPGRVYALMGPNGSGKTTLALALAGHPSYAVTAGSVTLDGEDLLAMSPDRRAKAGVFLSFQYPASIPGVKVANFLFAALQAVRPGDLGPAKFRALLLEKMESLGMDPSFLGRYLNDGFSGGEKKRLDVDALRHIGESIAALRATEAGKNTGLLVITHYPRILRYVHPDVVHVMLDGRIVKTGGGDLAELIELQGYDVIRAESGAVA